MVYSYDRRANHRAASVEGEGGKLWKEVEDFLYPPWCKGSSYRGDLRWTQYENLLAEFYQNPERLSEDDRESVPDALARAKAANDKEWKQRRQDALETIKELPDPEQFTERDVRKYMYTSTLDRLVYEGVLERHGHSYALASK